MTRAVIAAFLLVALCGACSFSHTTTPDTISGSSTSVSVGVIQGDHFATVADLSRWLASKGIDCPLRSDEKSCSLRSAKGAKTTPEVIELAVAPNEDQLDKFFTEVGSGYMLSGETWALHVASQANTKALLVDLPHANYWHATPMTLPR